ncbi:hypothetical protein KKF32_03050 [Patescibacteria group bacterium]|nr:hypothetical protein [Patescibacteria group bacterium]
MNNLIKKTFLISMIVMTSLWGVMGVVNVSEAAIATAGDLIKTDSSPAVYYLGADGKKYTFHHSREYFTWYNDFSGVVTVPSDEMVSYPLGTTIVVRPGSKLVQYVEVQGDGTWNVSNTPEVYGVGTNGTLHQIDSAATAVALYGANWESMIVPLPNYLNANYTTGDQLTASSMYPSGTLVKTADDSQVYYVDGSTKRPVTDDGATYNRFNMDYVVTAGDLSGYTDGTSITGLEGDLANPQGGASSTISGTGLTLALGTGTPGAQVVPLKATNVPLMDINVTASSDGAVTLNSLVVKRMGVGAAADFEALYLYDGIIRLTNGKSINSTTHKATFTNLNYQIAAGATKTLKLVADMDTSSAGTGDVHYFRIESADVGTSATVNGSFPLQSNTISVGATTAGTVTVTKYGTLTNPNVGQTEAEVAQFKMAVTGENVTVNRISLYQGGSTSNSNLTNWKLYQDTELLATASGVNSDSLVVFDLSATPYTITKNQDKVLVAKADIGTASRNTETVKTYLEYTTDVYAVGDTYGYGAFVDIGTSGTYDGTSTNYSEVTIQGGQVTVGNNGPSATNLAVNNDNQVWLDFTITAGVNLEVKSWRVEIHNDGTDLDILDTQVCSGTTSYLTNVRIAATDGSFTTDYTDACNFTDIATDGGIYTTYTDTLEMAAGTSKAFQILVDTETDFGTTGNYYAVLGNTTSGSTSTFSSTAIKNVDNNQYITDIVPSSFTQGKNMTYAASSLTTALGNYQGRKDVVKGANDVELLYYNFTAGSGGAVTVKSIKFASYVNAAGDATSVMFNRDQYNGDVYAKDVVDSLKIYEKNGSTYTQLGTIKAIDSSGYVTFSSLSWNIPSGQTKTVVLKGNINPNAYYGSTADEVAFDIFTTSSTATHISAVDQSGNTISAITAQYNGGSSTTSRISVSGTVLTYIRVANAGNIYVSDNDSPVGGLVVAGTNDLPVLKLKFNATDESFSINKLRVSQTWSTTNRAVSSIKISYKNQAGDTVTASQGLSGSNADFNISSNPIYVPVNGVAYVDVYANINGINGTNAAYSGDGLKFFFDENGNFEAVGSATKTQTDSTSDITGSTMVVHKAVPTFAKVSLGTSTFINGGLNNIYKFTVTASEGSSVDLKKLNLKVTLGGPDPGASLTLDQVTVLENGSALTKGDTGSSSYRVYSGKYSTAVAAAVISGDVDGLSSTVSTAQNMFIVFNDARTVSEGSTKTYTVQGVLEGATTANSTYSIQTYLTDGTTSTATANKYLDAWCATASAAGAWSKYCLTNAAEDATTAPAYIWSDYSGTDGNGVHTDVDQPEDSASSADWFNSYELDELGITSASVLEKTT